MRKTNTSTTFGGVGTLPVTLFEAAGLDKSGQPIDPEKVIADTAHKKVLEFSRSPHDITSAKVAIDSVETLISQWAHQDHDSPCAPNVINERSVLALIAGLKRINMLDDGLFDDAMKYTICGSWASHGIYELSVGYIRETIFSAIHRVSFLYGAPDLAPDIYGWAETNLQDVFVAEWRDEFDARLQAQHAIRVGTIAVPQEILSTA